MRLSLAWAERCKRAFESAPPGRALFGIVQGGDDAALRARERAGAGRDRLSRLRHRRACGRRAAGRHAQGGRGDRAAAAGRPAALSDGRRHAGRSDRGGGARHRHVRLRAADPQRPPRRGVHPLRPDQSAQRAAPRRSAAARRGRARTRRRAPIRAPISASRAGQRNARRDAAVRDQSRLLPGADGRDARSDRARPLRGFLRR